MQCRDDGHPQVMQECQDVTAARTTIDAEFVLQRNDINVAEIQEVGAASVVFKLLLDHLELNFLVVRISTNNVVHRDNNALGARCLHDRASQVVRESGDAAFAWHVVADESDFVQIRRVHDCDSCVEISESKTDCLEIRVAATTVSAAP